eukprot:2034167-Rhodomonas_salina.1
MAGRSTDTACGAPYCHSVCSWALYGTEIAYGAAQVRYCGRCGTEIGYGAGRRKQLEDLMAMDNAAVEDSLQ